MHDPEPAEPSTPSAPVAPPADDQFARALRGFGPIGLIAIALILLTGNIFLEGLVVPAGALLVLLWVHLSRTPWSEIGYVRPKNWLATIAIGIVFGVAFKCTMKAIVMPLLGADPINWTYHAWQGNRAALPFAIWAMFVAGFGEETVFRGFAFERLGKILGHGALAKMAIVLLTAVWFGLAHYSSQGLTGTEQATIVGLTFGGIFARTRRIFLLMIAHTAFDLTALAMIYWGWETRVAHLIFH